VVSGGFSFTTLRATISHLLQPDIRPQFGKITCIYGARSAGELLYKEEIRAWESNPQLSLHLCVDRACSDGWPLLEGLVPDILRSVAPSSTNAIALVCGPPIMIRYTYPVLTELGFKPEQVFLSLENRMKCGIGKCGHCNIGPKYVCKDGPIFSWADLTHLPAEY
ncbi:MAG: heterodisulfide reductase subunit F, partial [candidate division WOR-3 bacterium]